MVVVETVVAGARCWSILSIAVIGVVIVILVMEVVIAVTDHNTKRINMIAVKVELKPLILPLSLIAVKKNSFNNSINKVRVMIAVIIMHLMILM